MPRRSGRPGWSRSGAGEPGIALPVAVAVVLAGADASTFFAVAGYRAEPLSITPSRVLSTPSLLIEDEITYPYFSR